MKYCDLKELVGQTLVKVDSSLDTIFFYTDKGGVYKMYHEQSCCESVTIDDINGDLQDLVGTPITLAEEVRNEDFQKQWLTEQDQDYLESYTWTFYKLATIKGYVDIRWYGYSNGYYSESVDFCRVEDNRDKFQFLKN